MDLCEAALRYHRAGLCVLPALADQKRPALAAWKTYQTRLPTPLEVSRWFANAQGLCLICGTVSGNVEMLDFDVGGEAFEAWYASVAGESPDLLARLVVEQSPSGGWHVVYRCEVPVCGNLKLAQRSHPTDDAKEVTIGGKSYKPRRDADGQWHVLLTLIETRGEGGLFLCAPTHGYELMQGDFAELPVLTEAERELLLESAWALNQRVRDVPAGTSPTTSSADGRPGDDFNQRGAVRDVLRRHGWTLAKPGENEYWRRPGKASGWSATLKNNVFYVFSSSAAPFEPQQTYSPFAVYALLEHGGDFELAARSLGQLGYGGNAPTDTAGDPNISGIVRAFETAGNCASNEADLPQPMGLCSEEVARESQIVDPGDTPDELLRVPGFISEVMDHCLAAAPYPNQVMAFGGALVLQAFLAGRKVRDPGDNRTNLYLLGLAHSSAGKDQSRKVNSEIIHAIGMGNCLGLHFASGEAIQDSLVQTPTMLFQTDEIDGLLQSINKAKDARHEAIMGAMLTMYSSANSVFPVRRKAGKELPAVIDQPCLVIYGTAIPNHYYQALSERMLTNGFFARMIVLEARARGPGQEPSIHELPSRVLATAKWWADYRPGTGNLEHWHPVPTIVEHSEEATRLLIETRLEAEAEYSKAEASCDPVGTTVWGRVSEQTRKLALLYAVSENHQTPRIGQAAIEWASRFVRHQTQRMLFKAASHVADNPFHAVCLKLMEKLRDAPGRELPHSMLLKRMKVDAKTFGMLVETLVQQGDIENVTVPRPGWHARSYRLTRR